MAALYPLTVQRHCGRRGWLNLRCSLNDGPSLPPKPCTPLCVRAAALSSPPLPSPLLPPALHSIVREGNSKAAAKTLQDLYAALNQAEPKNAELFCR